MSSEFLLRPLLEIGLEAHRQGDLEAAKAAFRRALVLAPNDPDALNLYGTTVLQGGDPGHALQYLQRAAQLGRNNPVVIGTLAQAYFELERFAEAHENFRKASRLEPRAEHFQLGAANSLAMQGKLAAAEELLKRIATRFPHSPLIWFNLGNV